MISIFLELFFSLTIFTLNLPIKNLKNQQFIRLNQKSMIFERIKPTETKKKKQKNMCGERDSKEKSQRRNTAAVNYRAHEAEGPHTHRKNETKKNRTKFMKKQLVATNTV